MKLFLSSLLLFASLPAALADGFEKPVSDSDVRKSFEQKLTELLDGGKTAPVDELVEQLKARKTVERRLPEAEGKASGTASIYQSARGGVLCFGNLYKCDRCDRWHGNIAGGFVISEDGLAVTNYHVMESERAAAFGAMDVEGNTYPVVEVVAASKRDDLAIVRLEGEGFKPLPIAKGDEVGAEVTVISHPEGRFYTVSKGIISRYYRSRGSNKNAVRMAITADFAKGSSGSPVLNNDGEVVGVVTSTDSIYYNQKDGVEQNLQMVVKSCIPSGAIFDLLSGS